MEADPNPAWTRAPWAGVPQPPSAPAPASLRGSLGSSEGAGPSSSRAHGAPTMPMPPPPPRASDPSGASRADPCAPATWREYFDEARDVAVASRDPGAGPPDVFRVYVARARDASGARASAPPSLVIFCVHGCAYTALSWAPTARHLAARLGPSAAIVAMDLRGHGESRAANERDVSAATLASDVAAVATRVAESRDVFSSPRGAAAAAAPPRLVLVGHSLGGAIVARVAAGTAVANVAGVVLVDAAESAAREAIPRMEATVRRESSSLARQSRPLGFDALRDVVEWAVRTRQTLDVASAAISYPSQLVPACDGTEDSATHRWRWRVDLGATTRFWRGWFEGLTATFLSDALRETPKLLVLAGMDRVAEDPEMLVAQMRGAFQTVVIPEAGHACHEDRPAEVADALASFAERNSGMRRSK